MTDVNVSPTTNIFFRAVSLLIKSSIIAVANNLMKDKKCLCNLILTKKTII